MILMYFRKRDMKILSFLLLLTAVLTCADARAGKHKTRTGPADSTAVNYRAMQLIPRLFADHKTDSLYSVVTAWEEQCKAIEPIVSFTIVNEIFRRTFYGGNDTAFFVHARDIYLYEQQVAAYKGWYLFGSYLEPETPIADINDTIAAVTNNYYIFIRSLAISMLDKPGLAPLEQALVQYYADPLHSDTARMPGLTRAISNGGGKEHAGKKGQDGFGFRQDDRHGFGNELGIISGVWMPTGPLSGGGPHPCVGLTWGFEFNKLFLCLDGHFTFANGRSFSLKYNDYVYSAQCSNAYFGLDWRYHLNLPEKNELCLVGGVAIDGAGTSLDNNKTVSFASPNINIGLGYKVFFYHKTRRDNGTNNMYLLLEAKYNYVNYQSQTNGYPGIGGNSFTLSISARYLYQWWVAGERSR